MFEMAGVDEHCKGSSGLAAHKLPFPRNSSPAQEASDHARRIEKSVKPASTSSTAAEELTEQIFRLRFQLTTDKPRRSASSQKQKRSRAGKKRYCAHKNCRLLRQSPAAKKDIRKMATETKSNARTLRHAHNIRSSPAAVTSAKMEKTIVVEVLRWCSHPNTAAWCASPKKFYAHDEQRQAKPGDTRAHRRVAASPS